MAKKLKRWIFLSLCLCLLFSLTGCGQRKKDEVEVNPETLEGLTSRILDLYNGIPADAAAERAGYEEEELSELSDALSYQGIPMKGNAFQSGFASFKVAEGEMGGIDLTQMGKPVYRVEDKEIICDVSLKGKNGKEARAEFTMNKNYIVTGLSVNVNRSLQEKITNGLLNTILGMGTTFCVLIIVSLAIWLMGLIAQSALKPKAEEKLPVEKVAEQIAQREEALKENREDSGGELIAVLAAAVAAYESGERGVQVSPDAFIVRSVRRRR